MIPVKVLPPGPLCKVCGHMPCPCCMQWCDVVLDGEALELCCDGQCSYDPNDYECWLADQNSYRAASRAMGNPVVYSIEVASGPFMPYAARVRTVFGGSPQ